jgi:hypothetical protein
MAMASAGTRHRGAAKPEAAHPRLARCGLCGWKQLFVRPGRVPRAEADHRCDPLAARPRGELRRPEARPCHSAGLAAILAAAADDAGRECSVIGAVDAAWAALNADKSHTWEALQAWAQSELYCADLRGFGGFLRRRYRTAAQVDGSLRAAADQIAGPLRAAADQLASGVAPAGLPHHESAAAAA